MHKASFPIIKQGVGFIQSGYPVDISNVFSGNQEPLKVLGIVSQPSIRLRAHANTRAYIPLFATVIQTRHISRA
jgi:hypothetical protein